MLLPMNARPSPGDTHRNTSTHFNTSLSAPPRPHRSSIQSSSAPAGQSSGDRRQYLPSRTPSRVAPTPATSRNQNPTVHRTIQCSGSRRQLVRDQYNDVLVGNGFYKNHIAINDKAAEAIATRRFGESGGQLSQCTVIVGKYAKANFCDEIYYSPASCVTASGYRDPTSVRIEVDKVYDVMEFSKDGNDIYGKTIDIATMVVHGYIIKNGKGHALLVTHIDKTTPNQTAMNEEYRRRQQEAA